MLIVGVLGYILITILAAIFMRPSFSVGFLTIMFYSMAVGIGLFQGGIQALSRAYFGVLIPKDKANEYFGFFDIFGKYAAIIGTGMMSLFTALTGDISMGLLSLVLLFGLGLFFLLKVPKESHELENLE
jgi:UMF1 family MFS transporter